MGPYDCMVIFQTPVVLLFIFLLNMNLALSEKNKNSFISFLSQPFIFYYGYFAEGLQHSLLILSYDISVSMNITFTNEQKLHQCTPCLYL